MKLFIDISTGTIRKALNSAPLPAVKFFAGDVIALEIELVSGRTNVTAEQLTGGKALKCALHGFPISSDALTAASLTLSSTSATGELDLTGAEVSEYLASSVPASTTCGECVFEVQIESSTTKETVSQARSLIARDLVPVASISARIVTDNDGTPLTDNDGTLVSDN